MAEKKAPTQAEAIEQVNQISADSGLNPKDQPAAVDPIVYRSDYKTENIIDGRDPKKLANADINISQYWDDSSAKNYNNSQLWWWENQKYTWENTKNSQVAYNANATLEWLDPNYKYWQAAQMANSEQANYIARRNDEIASALYNAWKTSMEDVAEFLNQQEWFRNSYENERQNTILSVWKRLGDIANQNKQNDTENPEWENTPLKNMEEDLGKSTAGEIYGKVTADQDTYIKTLEDENSVYKSMNEARIQRFKNLQSMDSNSIASAIISGVMAADDQQMRDLMQYDPAKYQEVKQAEKQIRWQMNINTITTGEGNYTTVATNGKSWLNNDIANFANSNSTSSTDAATILKDVNSTLASNQSFNSASETMDALESDMATLQNRLKNLKREANTVFKWDVPQYIVNAYVANRTQEIQDQLSILENRYNAAQSRANQEWSRTMDIMNYNLKVEELQLKREAAALEDYATRQWIAIDWAKLTAATTSTSTTVNWNTVQATSLTREEISTSIDDLVEACTNWQLGNAQCAAWIQKYYLPTLWVDLWSLSAYSAKQWICTDLAWEYTPQKWDLVVMSSSSKPENWHIGIVIGVDWDTLKYLDWNGSLDANGNWTQKAEIHTTKLNASKIYGYYNPTHWQSQTISWNGYYDPSYADIYGKYLQGKFAAWKQLETQANAMWKTVQQLDSEARAWKESQNNSQDVTTRLDAIARLMNTAWNNRTWRILSDYSLPQLMSSWYADFDAAYNFVRDNITFDKLLELKRWGATFWALSDNELRAIGNAAANLRKDMSNEEFQRQLTWIYNELLRWIWESSMTTTQIHDAFNTKLYTPSSISSSKQWNTNRSVWQTTQWSTNRWTQTSKWMTAEEKAKALQWF